jgi:hypothetical protein
MDNKNNRSFYWEVKDFLNKKPETFVPKKHSLKESISGILNENKMFRQSSFNEETHLTEDVSRYLRALTGEEKKYAPKNISYAKNSLANPFQLKEAWYNPFSWTTTYGSPPEADEKNTEEGWKNADRAEVAAGRMTEAEYRSRYNENPGQSNPNAAGGVKQGMPTPVTIPNASTTTSAASSDDSQEEQGQPDYGDDGSPTREDIEDAKMSPNTLPQSGEDRSYDDVEAARSRRSAEQQPVNNTIAAMQKPSTGPDVDALIKSQRAAYGMQAGYGEGGGAAGAAARTADRQARSDAIRDSNLNLRAEQDRLNRITRTGGTLSAEDAARLQDIKGALNRPQTQFGNQTQAGIGARYAARSTPTPVSTTATATSQTAGPGPGKTINAMTPEQIAAANNPAKGGQSGIFGAPNSTLTGGQVAAKVPGASPSTPSAATPGASPKPAPASTPAQKPQPQGDRRVDGNNEGAPSVRIAPNGNAYSPMPDWVKNRQQSSTPAPASVPSAQSNTSSTIGVGSAQPSTPAAQRSPGQAGAANTLGMGTTPPAAPQRSPGQAGAANTLGMGTTPPPQETESEATKRARQTLMR